MAWSKNSHYQQCFATVGTAKAKNITNLFNLYQQLKAMEDNCFGSFGSVAL